MRCGPPIRSSARTAATASTWPRPARPTGSSPRCTAARPAWPRARPAPCTLRRRRLAVSAPQVLPLPGARRRQRGFQPGLPRPQGIRDLACKGPAGPPAQEAGARAFRKRHQAGRSGYRSAGRREREARREGAVPAARGALRGRAGMSRTLTYRDALNEAMTEEMRRDRSVFTYGIDVGDHKRIFNSTKGLVEEFGPARCFSTPLAEDAMSGFGLGAAINGMRPVHVHMRMDFLLLGMNQLVNMIATHCYGSGGTMKVPMVIRAIIGRGWGQSYQHSKALHSWFAHVPGLKVVMPATPRDAKGMLQAAIRDDNPVVFIEH